MSESNAEQDEPSMEEILASIRRIISEEDEEENPDVAQAEPEAAPEPVDTAGEEEVEDDEVLVLTDMVEPDDEASEAGDDELVLEEAEPDPEPDPEPEPEPAPEPEPVAKPEPVGDDPLLSHETEKQSAAAISELVSTIGAATSLGAGDKTLEALTKELLRPLLKEWLDANLPGTVERIVREEIERVVAKSK